VITEAAKPFRFALSAIDLANQRSKFSFCHWQSEQEHHHTQSVLFFAFPVVHTPLLEAVHFACLPKKLLA
jgi:hypothetical protein